MDSSRRSLLLSTGMFALAATVPVCRSVAWAAHPLLLVDAALSGADRLAAGMPAPHVAIEADLVRQWHSGLGRQVGRTGGAVALVRWDKALVLSGLARESGLASRQRRLSRSLFEVTVALRT